MKVLVQQRKALLLSLGYNGDNSYLFTEIKIFKFKADNKNVNFPPKFCLGSISEETWCC